MPVLYALRGFSACGQWSNGQGQDNARAKGKCIIHPRPLLHCPSALINPIHVMHTKLVYKVFSVAHFPETAANL